MTMEVEPCPAAGKSEYSPGVPVDVGKSEFSLGMPADKKPPSRRVLNLCSTRYGIAFIAHFCNFTLIAQNSVINITMVAMVNSTDRGAQLNSSTEGPPASLNSGQHEVSKHLSVKAPVYDWSPQTQGLIFSSVQYGMMLMQAPGGYLAGRIGTKKVVGLALFGSSILTLCIPLAAHLGLAFLLATRAVQGLTQGAGYGGQFALWQRWAPPHERSRLCSIALSGEMSGLSRPVATQHFLLGSLTVSMWQGLHLLLNIKEEFKSLKETGPSLSV